MHFIVKLFPEITIKSAPVRKRMIKQLRDNLRKLLLPLEREIEVQRDWEKIEIIAPDIVGLDARIADVLARTPGIANFSRVYCFELGDFDDIADKTRSVWGERLANKTFVLRVKRSGQHDFKSPDVERQVGGALLHSTEAAGVKLRNPDITVRLEIRQQQLYVIEETRQGLGGFPLGSQEAVLSLISGGFDSTVSSYLCMKRGLRAHFCFFSLGGREHEVGVKEVAFYLWNKFGASHRVRFITVPFEEVVSEILTKIDNSQMGVVLKRMMLRAGTRVAEDVNLQALVTGESVAQVSSQTLTNLSVIDSVTNILVLRPLITSDKLDIIDIARHIGTEEFAAQMPEYCGVISVKPTTRARPERIEREEQHFDFDILERAIADRRVQNIDQVMEDIGQLQEITIVGQAGVNDVVVDIRHPGEEELNPLNLDGIQVLHIPFFSLHSRFRELTTDSRYLLYCEKGVMSQLHAAHLKDQGFDNVGVYRPEN